MHGLQRSHPHGYAATTTPPSHKAHRRPIHLAIPQKAIRSRCLRWHRLARALAALVPRTEAASQGFGTNGRNSHRTAVAA